jgi:hypothetical protein
MNIKLAFSHLFSCLVLSHFCQTNRIKITKRLVKPGILPSEENVTQKIENS